MLPHFIWESSYFVFSLADSEDESSDSDSNDDEPLGKRKYKIQPIERKGRPARPMRIQLLRRLTLKRACHSEQLCCKDACVDWWIWVRPRDVYRDFA